MFSRQTLAVTCALHSQGVDAHKCSRQEVLKQAHIEMINDPVVAAAVETKPQKREEPEETDPIARATELEQTIITEITRVDGRIADWKRKQDELRQQLETVRRGIAAMCNSEVVPNPAPLPEPSAQVTPAPGKDFGLVIDNGSLLMDTDMATVTQWKADLVRALKTISAKGYFANAMVTMFCGSNTRKSLYVSAILKRHPPNKPVLTNEGVCRPLADQEIEQIAQELSSIGIPKYIGYANKAQIVGIMPLISTKLMAVQLRRNGATAHD